LNETSRKKIGLALGGGVVRGMAHIGVLAVLEEANISIDFVAGTSAGSLVGALFATGLKATQILDFASKLSWWTIARPVLFSRWGYVSFNQMSRWLVRELGDLQFSDLKYPFTAVATDLYTGRPVELCEGRLAPAVQASCSIPGFVTPVELNGLLLGDGSLCDTVPVDVVRRMGADYVIGVDIFPPLVRPRPSPLRMGINAIEILVHSAGGGIDDADCLIAPKLGGMSYIRLSKQKEFFARGVQAAREKLDEIQSDLGQVAGKPFIPQAVP
jgi:NTE family protein